MSSADSLQALQLRLLPLRASLLEHPLYRRIDGPAALRTFMEHHSYAVWDFMSLLKALQQRLTCVAAPWLPPADGGAARLVNEIVLGEESDEDGAGGYASHFELYLRAMKQAGAATESIEQFVRRLSEGTGLETALADARAPRAAAEFVEATFRTIEQGSLAAMAAAFTFGREDLLPSVFEQIVAQANASTGEFAEFQYYLQRHIELDGEEHGPMAARLVRSLCGDDAEHWRQAEEGAVAALQARMALWDGMKQAIDAITAA